MELVKGISEEETNEAAPAVAAIMRTMSLPPDREAKVRAALTRSVIAINRLTKSLRV